MTDLRIEAGKWQPISSAPKNTAILLYASGVEVGHFNTTNNKWWTQTDGTKTAGERLLNSWNKPSHWMPLPKTPLGQGLDGEGGE